MTHLCCNGQYGRRDQLHRRDLREKNDNDIKQEESENLNVERSVEMRRDGGYNEGCDVRGTNRM